MSNKFESDEFTPESIKLMFNYFQDSASYIFLTELLESALFFNTAAAMQLKNIRISRTTNRGEKLVIPNFMSIVFSPSGSGKGLSVKSTSEPFDGMFKRFIERAEAFTLDSNNRDEKNELNPQYIAISHQYTPSGSTVQGVQKYAQSLTDMGFGAVNIYDDEIGDNMSSMGDIFTKMKTGFDDGISYAPVNVSSGGANYFTVENICFNSLLMGSESVFDLNPKLKDQLLSHLVSGISRRSYIFSNSTYKKSESRNPNFESMSDENIKIAKDYFAQIVSHINNVEKIILPEKIYQQLIEYDVQKEILRENSDSVLADNLGSPNKIMRLAGIIAVLDLSSTITEDHLRYAISFTERVDETTELAYKIKSTYEQIYELLEKRAFISRTELIKELKGVTIKNLEEEMILATELANQLGNSIVIKEYSGIVKYKLERLTKTVLDKVIMSINEDPSATNPQGFKRIEGDFKDLGKKVLTTTRRYSAGTFLNQYITDKNYLSEQNIIIIDIDDGITIDEAKSLFKNTVYVIATTKSHQKQKDKKIACDRFRIVLPTVSKFHVKPEVYSVMYGNLLDSLGMDSADISCRNSSRWYYGFPDGDFWYNDNDEAELLDIRPFIPDTSENKSSSLNVINYDLSTNNTSGSDSYDEDEIGRKKSGMIRWMLSQTTEGNRNQMCFQYAMFVKKNLGLDIESNVSEFNNILSNPLPEGELMKIIKSASRR